MQWDRCGAIHRHSASMPNAGSERADPQIEAGKTAPGYISAMILWVEPLTGWVIVMGSG